MTYKDPEKQKAYDRERSRRRRQDPAHREYHREYQKSHQKEATAYQKEWLAQHPGRQKRYFDRCYLKKMYGITPEEYETLLEQQGGKCACCSKAMSENTVNRRFAVDHDHGTGAIRGLLCHNCNVGLGHLGDSVEGLERALAYLKRSGVNLPARSSP